MATETLTIRVRADGARVVQRDLRAIGNTGEKAKSSILGLKSAVAGIGAGLALKGAISAISAFGAEMSKVKAITGATGNQFKELRETAKELGATTRFTATQAAESMAFLARAGFETEEILAAVGDTLDLATAGVLDLGRAADISSNIMSGFGIEAQEMTHIADILSKTANSTNTNIEQLGEAMKFVAPIAASMGVAIEDAAASIGVLGDSGLQGSIAGTGLRGILASLEKPTRRGRKVLSELNLEEKEVQITTVGLVEAIDQLAGAHISAAQAIHLFGKLQAPSALALIRGKDKAKELGAEMVLLRGYAASVADEMNNNLKGAFVEFKSAIEGVAIELGDLGLEEGLTDSLRATTLVIRDLTKDLDVILDVMLLLGIAFSAKQFGPFIQGTLAASAAQVKLTADVLTNKVTILDSAKANLIKAKAINATSVAEAKGLQATRAAIIAEREQLLVNQKHIISQHGRIKNSTKVAQVRLAEVAITKQLTAAELRLATSTSVLAAAQKKAAISTRALAVATKGFNTALAFLGGPVGALMIAVSAFLIFRKEVKETDERIKEITGSAFVLREEIWKLSKMKLKLNLINTDEEIEEIDKLKKELTGEVEETQDLINRLNKSGFSPKNKQFDKIKKDLAEYKSQLEDIEIASIALENKKLSIQVALNVADVKDEEIAGPSRRELGVGALPEPNRYEGQAADIVSDFEDYRLSLLEINELTEDATNLEKLRFDLANTGLMDISQAQKSELETLAGLADMTEHYTQQQKKLNAEQEKVEKVTSDLEAQNEILQKATGERSAYAEVLKIERQLEVQLTTAQRESLSTLIEQNMVLKDKAAILEEVQGPLEDFKNKLQAIKELLSSEDISEGDAAERLLGIGPAMLEATATHFAALENQHAEFKEKIRMANEAGLVSDKERSLAEFKNDSDLINKKLATRKEGLSALATLQSSSNSKLAAVGKAAAIANATIDTYKAATGAYASLASIPYVGPALGAAAAAAAIAAGLANVAQIRNQTTSRALGGDLNAGQVSRVGESSFNRPEMFTGNSGQQFLIPPERGRVTPLNKANNNNSGNSENPVVVNPSPASVNVINVLDPNLMEEYLTSSEGEETLINVIQRNSSQIKEAVR